MLKLILNAIAISCIVSQSFAQQTKILSERKLVSDGSEGVETYELIKSVLGPSSIEAPDLYNENHPGVKHIIEENDAVIGNHFTFLMHRDIDRDRDTDKEDRQRNEIKAYSGSENALKGFHGESMRYHWYFQLDEDFAISQNFSHFFQLKSVGGDYASQPIVTISGSINGGKEQFEFMHSRLTGNEDQQLANTEWKKVNTGEWMEMEVLTTYKDTGYLKITVKNLQGEIILETEHEGIDMWREGAEFVRPKWGIYRGLNSKHFLNEEEDHARFADFTIQKVIFNYTPVPPGKTGCLYPFNKASFMDTALTLQWTLAEGSAYSKIYMGTDSVLNTNNLIDSVSGSRIDIGGLEPNTQYFWRVDGVNSDGQTFSDVWSFTTASLINSCNEIYIIAIEEISASNELTNFEALNVKDNNLETTWGAQYKTAWLTVDFGQEASVSSLLLAFVNGYEQFHNFELQSSSDGVNFSTISLHKSNGLTSGYQTVLFPEINTRYLRYQGLDTMGGENGILSEFHVYGCGASMALPSEAVQINPENEKDEVSINLNFNWCPGLGAETHNFYLGKTAELNVDNLVAETTDTMILVKNLNYETTYYWRVDEVNEGGTTEGKVWSFNTMADTTVGIYDRSFEELEIAIYPNPVKDNLKVKAFTATAQYANVVIFNIHGQQVKKVPQIYLNVNSNEFVFDVSGLDIGVYAIVFQTPLKTERQAFVKM